MDKEKFDLSGLERVVSEKRKEEKSAGRFHPFAYPSLNELKRVSDKHKDPLKREKAYASLYRAYGLELPEYDPEYIERWMNFMKDNPGLLQFWLDEINSCGKKA